MEGNFIASYLSLSRLLLGKPQHTLEEAVAYSPVTFYRMEGGEQSKFATFWYVSGCLRDYFLSHLILNSDAQK